MNFINLLRTWGRKFKMNNDKIRKDDLDALGGMANMVGTFMNDFAMKADSDARGKLFKGGISIRNTLAHAILPDENDAARIIIPDNAPLIDVPVPMTPPMQPSQPTQTVQNIPTSVQTVPLTVQNIPMMPTGRREDGPLVGRIEQLTNIPSPQMEFSFIKQSIQGYGNVGEVIKHFDERLDKIEESIKLIKMFMVELKGSLIKRKYNKVKDEPKETT